MRFFGWMLMISALAVPALTATTFYRWFRLRHNLPTWRSIWRFWYRTCPSLMEVIHCWRFRRLDRWLWKSLRYAP